MSHPLISNHADRLPRNEYGQPILADCGADDLWPYLTEKETLMPTIPGTIPGTRRARQTGEQVAVFLDTAAPARRYAGREPDFYDEGRAWWIGPEAVVSVPADRVPRFAEYVASRGMAPAGSPAGFTVTTFEGQVREGSLADLALVVRTCR
jgi:hypothetical protein